MKNDSIKLYVYILIFSACVGHVLCSTYMLGYDSTTVGNYTIDVMEASGTILFSNIDILQAGVIKKIRLYGSHSNSVIYFQVRRLVTSPGYSNQYKLIHQTLDIYTQGGPQTIDLMKQEELHVQRGDMIAVKFIYSNPLSYDLISSAGCTPIMYMDNAGQTITHIGDYHEFHNLTFHQCRRYHISLVLTNHEDRHQEDKHDEGEFTQFRSGQPST